MEKHIQLIQANSGLDKAEPYSRVNMRIVLTPVLVVELLIPL